MYLGWDVGIKNLAFCLLENKNKQLHIVDWGIINLLVHKPPKIYCNCLKKDGKICGKAASFYSLDSRQFCNTHIKKWKKNCESLPTKEKEETEQQMNKWSDKWCCSHSKCIKIATRYCVKDNRYFCTKHRNITDTLKDVINQSSATRMPLLTLGKILYDKLDKYPQLLQAQWICIENQPVLKNPTMKSIQIMLYSYFIMKNHEKKLKLQDMVLMSAKNKLKVYKNQWGEVPTKILGIKDKYRRNKQTAIEHTRLLIENEHEEEWNEFYTKHDKKDDLADAYLMTRYYLEK